MGLYLSILALLGCWLSWPQLSWSSNLHEHFYATPAYEDFALAHQEIFKRPLSEIPLPQLMGESELEKNISHIFPNAQPELTDQTEQGKQSQSWEKIKEDENLLKKLFTFSQKDASDIAHDTHQATLQYKAIENIRKGIMKGFHAQNPDLYQRFITAVYQHYFERVPLEDRLIIASSVPGDLVDQKSLEELITLAKIKGSDLSFYFSYPRYKLATETPENFTNKLPKIIEGLKQGYLKGVDITGSIEEVDEVKEVDQDNSSDESNDKSTDKSTDKNTYKQRLTSLSEILSIHKGIFKIHAFEKANQGSFYQALQEVIESWVTKATPLPASLSIAHINHLNNEVGIKFIKRLEEIKKGIKEKWSIDFPIFFEANLTSNHLLHGTEYQKLIKTIRLIHSHGFPVFLGSDGQGIWGDQSTLSSTLKKLMRIVIEETNDNKGDNKNDNTLELIELLRKGSSMGPQGHFCHDE